MSTITSITSTTTNSMESTMNTIEARNESKTIIAVQGMAADLFRGGLTPVQALAAAGAWAASSRCEDLLTAFPEKLGEVLVNGQPVEQDGELLGRVLVNMGYITKDEEVGTRWAELCVEKEKHYPIEATEFNTDKNGKPMVMDRKRGYAPNQIGNLARETFHALEATKYTLHMDTYKLGEAYNAYCKEQDKDYRDPEGYVMEGCAALDPKKAYFSEFFGDCRMRMYQGAAHGPNGQSSDRSRALMDLYGVSMDYDPKEAFQAIKDEMMDMLDDADNAELRAKLNKEAYSNPLAFIIAHHDVEKSGCSKPWSFVKAAKTLMALHKHINKGAPKPYIGMAVGLDAKCSGPQIASLMNGDEEIAAACGFTTESMATTKDAYMICCDNLHAAGFSKDITRKVIKKSFMGIFYGQGYAAFMTHQGLSADKQAITEELFNLIHGGEVSEEKAKRFHHVVSGSFGKNTSIVRNHMKTLRDKLQGQPSYTMPDGCVVKMDYRLEVNIEGEEIGYEVPAIDARVECGEFNVTCMKFKLLTQQADTNRHIRNGFVNMIQATDALMARLIIVHLSRMGVKHIISVHDCFRVSVGDMPKLKEAIKQAYTDLFVCPVDMPTKDFPMGTDILGLYFKGMKEAALPGIDFNNQSQFRANGRRITQRINRVAVDKLIATMGEKDGAWFFAK